MWLLGKAPWKAAIIAVTPVLIYIFVGRDKTFFPRNLVLAIPFLSLFGGAFIYFVYRLCIERLSSLSRPSRKVIINVILVLVLSISVSPQAVLAVDHIETITLPDTRWEV